jgi:hypothetical protein
MSLTVSTIADTTTAFNTATGALAWTLSGIVGTITLEGASLNTDVVPSANIVFGGSGSSRTVTITPATGEAGFATIVLTATDDNDDLPVTTTFLLAVSAASATAWVPPSGWEAQEVGPDSEHDRTGDKFTLNYAAPYASVDTDKPADGQTVSGYSGVIVLSVKVSPKSAETGDSLCFVTIELGPESRATGGSDGVDFQPTFTRRWERLEKPLLSHPMFQEEGDSTLTNNDLAQIEAWQREPNATLKGAFQFLDSGTASAVTLSANAQIAAEKMLKGTEVFPFYIPVVSMVSLVSSRPLASTTAGKWFNAPPGFPSGTFPVFSGSGIRFIWVGIEDDAQRQGRSGPWTHTLSFQGVEAVDADLYPAG